MAASLERETMNKREERIAKYTADLEKLGVEVDAALLDRCVTACGPSIYKADAETVAATDPKEVDRLRKNFVEKHLGVSDPVKADAGIDAAIERYGHSNRNKYRAVMYYLLSQHFGSGPTGK